MTTRRFTDDLPDPSPSPTQQPDMPTPPTPETASTPKPLGNKPRGAKNNRGGAHLPRTLSQVITEADEKVVQGDLVDYMPTPSGFDPLDGLIGGGLRKTELVLLGGAQGIGKTITALQIARNVAMRPDQYAFYLSYEHTETHLMHRLLCLESINPPEVDLSSGLKLRDLYQIIVAQRAKKFMGRDGSAGSLQSILRDHPKTSPSTESLAKICRPNDYAQSKPSCNQSACD